MDVRWLEVDSLPLRLRREPHRAEDLSVEQKRLAEQFGIRWEQRLRAWGVGWAGKDIVSCGARLAFAGRRTATNFAPRRPPGWRPADGCGRSCPRFVVPTGLDGQTAGERRRVGPNRPAHKRRRRNLGADGSRRIRRLQPIFPPSTPTDCTQSRLGLNARNSWIPSRNGSSRSTRHRKRSDDCFLTSGIRA